MWVFMGIGIALMFIAGFTIGYLVAKTQSRRYMQIVGTLKKEESDPDGPYLFLELKRDIDYITQNKYVTFEVDPRGYISRD